MTTIDEDLDEQEVGVPELVVEALTAAQRRAVEAGHPLVMIKDGALVRIQGSAITLLKQLPERRKVTIRTKKRTHG